MVSILETISLRPAPAANRSGPISRAEQSRAEQSQSTRSEVTATRPLGHCQRVAGLNSQLDLQVWGARLQSQFNEIRINRPIESICHPHLVSPRLPICGRSRLSFFCSSSCCSCHFSQPHPASSPADALRCTCRQTEPSRGKSRPLSARLPTAAHPSSPGPVGTGVTGSRAPADASLAPRCGPSNRLIGPAPAIISAVPTTFTLPTTTLPFPIFTPCCCYCRLLLLCCCWTEASTLQSGFPI